MDAGGGWVRAKACMKPDCGAGPTASGLSLKRLHSSTYQQFQPRRSGLFIPAERGNTARTARSRGPTGSALSPLPCGVTHWWYHSLLRSQTLPASHATPGQTASTHEKAAQSLPRPPQDDHNGRMVTARPTEETNAHQSGMSKHSGRAVLGATCVGSGGLHF